MMTHAAKATSLSAFLFPGSGHIYLKHYIRGAIFIVIAAIGLTFIMLAVFDVAWGISQQIAAGKVAFDLTTLLDTVHQSMAVFDEPQQKTAKYAIIGSWIVSTIDAYREGKNKDQQE